MAAAAFVEVELPAVVRAVLEAAAAAAAAEASFFFQESFFSRGCLLREGRRASASSVVVGAEGRFCGIVGMVEEVCGGESGMSSMGMSMVCCVCGGEIVVMAEDGEEMDECLGT